METSAVRSEDRQAGVFERILLLGLTALLMFGTLAFGATEPWSIFIMQAGAMLLLLLWGAKQSVSGRLHAVSSPLFLPVLAFGVLVATQLVLKLSVYPHATRGEALEYVAYGVLLFIVVQCLRTTADFRVFGWCVTVFGSLVAVFAVVQDLTFNGKLYWLRTTTDFGMIYGPYVNHNHYAGMMEMLAGVPLVLSMAAYVPKPARVLSGFVAALMGATIFLSKSRGGMIAFAAQLIFVAVLLGRRRHGQKVLIWLVLFVVAVVGLIWLSETSIYPHISTLGHPLRPGVAGVRLTIVKDSVRMFVEKPILGWGLGTFPTVYPGFRSFYTSFFVNQAHNDYVQVLVETGAVGFLLVIWFLMQLYRVGLGGIDRWQLDPAQAVRLGALVGCTGIVVHSFGDFNLHIPANAAWFYVLCAVATARRTSPGGSPWALFSP